MTETLNLVLTEVLKLGGRMDRLETRMDSLEDRIGKVESGLKFHVDRLERKISESIEFTRDSIVFIGDKVIGDHEGRLVSLENS